MRATLQGLPMGDELAVQRLIRRRWRIRLWLWWLGSLAGLMVTCGALMRVHMDAAARLELVASGALWLAAVSLGWSWVRRGRFGFGLARRGRVHRMGHRLSVFLREPEDHVRVLAETVVDGGEARRVVWGLLVLDVLAVLAGIAAVIRIAGS